MGGLREKMPITARTFLVGALAIAGVPGLSGFFSKDMVLEAAYVSGHWFVWLLGLIGAGCTAFYIFRADFLTFTGESRLDPHTAAHVHEMPRVMTVPLVILAALAAVGGWIGLPGGWLWGDAFGHYLAPVLAEPHGHHGHPSTLTLLSLMLVTTSVALAGIAWAWLLYVRQPELLPRVAAVAGRLYDVLWNKYWIDEVYEAAVLRPYRMASRFAWKAIDATIIDGVVNGAGQAVSGAGLIWRRLQTGNVQHYALGMVVGAIVVVSYYYIR
jgi:NADH-quinone oxidoreductase subunit L